VPHGGMPGDREVKRHAGVKMLREAIPTAIIGIGGGLFLYGLERSCLTVGNLFCYQVSFIEFYFDLTDAAILIALVLFGSILVLMNSGPEFDREPFPP
jgi:hypothetical protein